MIEYEEEKPRESCKNCAYCQFDEWYHGEKICNNPYSDIYGLSVDNDDHCDDWEPEDE